MSPVLRATGTSVEALAGVRVQYRGTGGGVQGAGWGLQGVGWGHRAVQDAGYKVQTQGCKVSGRGLIWGAGVRLGDAGCGVRGAEIIPPQPSSCQPW